MKLGLRAKLLIPMVLTIVLGMIVTVDLSRRRSASAIEEAVRAGLVREVQQCVRQIDFWLEARQTDLATWNRNVVYREALTEHGYYGESAREGASEILAELKAGYPYYDGLLLVTPEGDVAASHNLERTKYVNIRDRAYFKTALSGHACVSNVVVSRESEEPVFIVAAPVIDQGRVLGVMGGVVNVAAFGKLFLDEFNDRAGYVLIAERKGRVLAQSRHESEELEDISRYDFGRDILANGIGSIIYTHGGVRRIASYDATRITGWILVEALSLDEALASTRATGVYLALAGLCVVVCVSTAVVLLYRRMLARPLTAMLGGIARIESGDFAARIPGKASSDEMGVLTEAFNGMTARLQRSRDALQAEIVERTRAERELAAHRDRLEETVATRTAELIRSNEELKRTIALRERAETELNKAKEAAEDANRAKSEFLANMSHEIRTPMTAILGFADVLLESDEFSQCFPEKADAADTIRRNGQYLLSIINDILDLSKIEAGKMRIERVVCAPTEIIREVVSLIGVRAESKGLRFEVVHDGPIPKRIRTDPTRLRQILINLIGNAIKFTEQGKVLLTARHHVVSSGVRLEYEVRDTGIGMTPEQAAGLFQPFSQSDASMTRRFGGTGLGLTISRRFAQILGGDVHLIESRPGRGSCFGLTIEAELVDDGEPIESANSNETSATINATAAPNKTISLNGCRVLLVEDGPDNQRLIAYMLRKAGAAVDLAENGLVALENATSARKRNAAYHVILMDMQMPIMDGYTATRELRRRGCTAYIMALTAHTMSGDREKCLLAGCDAFHTKPIQRQSLIAAIFEAYARHTTHDATAGQRDVGSDKNDSTPCARQSRD